MSALVETMAYAKSGGVPWHGMGVPVEDWMTVEDMLDKAGLNWTVSKREVYFRKASDNGKIAMRIVPEDYALVRDTDETVLDVVGSAYKPIQNADVLDFFDRFVKAGDMTLETAGSLRNGRFIWALAKIRDGAFSFGPGGIDRTEAYLLLSQPHQLGYSFTCALTAVRVVCWNTITAALGSNLDGSRTKGATFRMTHAQAWNDDMKAQAEMALGLATTGMKAFSHTAEMLSGVKADDDALTDYFHDVLQIELKPEDEVTPEVVLSAEQEAQRAAIEESKAVKRFREALTSAPGQELPTAKGNWWGAFNAVTYTADHVIGRSDDSRLFSAWYGNGASMKRRALDLAVEYAKAA